MRQLALFQFMQLRRGLRAILGVIVAAAATAVAQSPATRPAAEPAWSDNATEITPAGNLEFHGPFCDDIVDVEFNALPDHSFVRIEFDLLILRSWDGSVQYVKPASPEVSGPDDWRCSIAGGPMLVSTTFSNLPVDDGRFMANCKTQNYPSPVPGDLLPPKTGSAAAGTLGYEYFLRDGSELVPMDATYHVALLVPHTAAKLVVRTEGIGLGSEGQRGILDESWGLRDVKITPLTAENVPAPDDAAIAAAFATALDVTATTQPAVVNTLVSGMDRTAAWITQNVQPHGIDAGAVAAAINDLSGDDNHIAERTAAGGTLFHMGPAVEPYLRDALKVSHGEARERIEGVLRRLGVTPITEEDLRRVALATRVLEVIGTPAALDVRKHLVGAA